MSQSSSLAGHNVVVLPFNITPLDLVVKRKINDHAKARFRTLVKYGEKDQYVNKTEAGTIMEIKYKEAGTEFCIFKGMVTNIDVESVNNTYYVEVEGISSTYEMDLKPKRRSFQNKDMLYKDLVKKVMEGYAGSDFIDEAAKSKKLDKFIIQYDETDWQFLKRLASHFNGALLPDYTSDKPRFWFGVPNGSSKGSLEEYNYSVNKNVGEFRLLEQNSVKGITESDFIYYKVESDRVLNIGDIISFKDQNLSVCEASAVIKNGVIRNEYILCKEKGMSQKLLLSDHLAGVSVEGKVIDIKEDNIRIHLEIDKDQNKEEAFWFPYSTFYTAEGETGWYCMPELEDSVKLYFPTNKEEEGIALNSMRRRTKGGDFITDPDTKIFRTRYGKELMFNKNEILVSAKDGQIFIRLLEDMGIEIYSKKDVRIIADKNISMLAGNNIEMLAQKKIGLKCKESTIEMDGEIDIKGKEVRTN